MIIMKRNYNKGVPISDPQKKLMDKAVKLIDEKLGVNQMIPKRDPDLINARIMTSLIAKKLGISVSCIAFYFNLNRQAVYNYLSNYYYVTEDEYLNSVYKCVLTTVNPILDIVNEFERLREENKQLITRLDAFFKMVG